MTAGFTPESATSGPHGTKNGSMKLSITIRRYGTLLVLGLAALGVFATPPLEQKVKAAYLYNFLLFVDWPTSAFADDSASKVQVCVIGEDPFRSALGPITERTAKKRGIRLSRLDSGADPGRCHLLYVSRSEEARLSELLADLADRPVLTTSDIPGFVDRGGMIGFTLKDGRVLLEANLQAARRSGLRISSKLLEVAVRVLGN